MHLYTLENTTQTHTPTHTHTQLDKFLILHLFPKKKKQATNKPVIVSRN